MSLFNGFSASRPNQETEIIYERLAEVLDNERVSAHNADGNCSAD